jgi:hypothetical protein
MFDEAVFPEDDHLVTGHLHLEYISGVYLANAYVNSDVCDCYVYG